MKIKLVPDVATNQLPEGIKCKLCHKIARPGQFVMHERVRNFGHLLWHFDCVEQMVEDSRDFIEDIDGECDRITREELSIYV